MKRKKLWYRPAALLCICGMLFALTPSAAFAEEPEAGIETMVTDSSPESGAEIGPEDYSAKDPEENGVGTETPADTVTPAGDDTPDNNEGKNTPDTEGAGSEADPNAQDAEPAPDPDAGMDADAETDPDPASDTDPGPAAAPEEEDAPSEADAEAADPDADPSEEEDADEDLLSATTFTFQDLRISVSGGSASVTGYSGSDASVMIPETVSNGGTTYTVTEIASYAFSGSSTPQSVSIPKTVTYVGSYAFQNCSNLKAVTFNGACRLGGSVFEKCRMIDSIVVKGNLTTNSSENNFYYAGNGVASTIVRFAEGVTDIPEYLFQSSGITSVVLPSTIESIGQYAFSGTHLRRVEVTPRTTACSNADSYTQKYGMMIYSGNDPLLNAAWILKGTASVRLDASAVTLNRGASRQLKATVTPGMFGGKAVTWKSSDTSVVTVNSTGKITAKKKGSATVTATAGDGFGKASCKVTVSIPVSGVKLNKTAVTLAPGKTVTLKATVSPSDASSKKVTWKSSNTKVASVNSSGKVTAAKVTGTKKATITATTDDGKKVAKCVVTVRNPSVTYRTHVQSFGWQSYVKDGTVSGTQGKAKRLEGINIKLTDLPYSGGISYRTHIQTYGWETKWKTNGAMSGTSGQAKRLEAIQIKLTGDMAKHYDIYYRVHAQHFGWMGWAKNGASAGTAGYAYRLEGIQIVLVEKGKSAPSTSLGSNKQTTVDAFIDKADEKRRDELCKKMAGYYGYFSINDGIDWGIWLNSDGTMKAKLITRRRHASYSTYDICEYTARLSPVKKSGSQTYTARLEDYRLKTSKEYESKWRYEYYDIGHNGATIILSPYGKDGKPTITIDGKVLD